MFFQVFRSSAEAEYVVKDYHCAGVNPKIEDEYKALNHCLLKNTAYLALDGVDPIKTGEGH